jgi:hypothetical protein
MGIANVGNIFIDQNLGSCATIATKFIKRVIIAVVAVITCPFETA